LEELLEGIDEARKKRVPVLPDGTEKLAGMIIELLCEGHD